jgi:hypothetical protein
MAQRSAWKITNPKLETANLLLLPSFDNSIDPLLHLSKMLKVKRIGIPRIPGGF